MTKEMLAVCRYYKDDGKAPEGDKLHLWDVERSWCQLQETEQGKQELGGMLDEYLSYGLREFENMDGVPITLKAIMFNRFSHWNRADTEEFKAWYLATYRQ